MDITNNLITLADGNQMPQEGFGIYKITDQTELTNSVHAAYEAGYRLFDTAQMYQNEDLLGKALADLDVSRDNLFIATKVNEANQGYESAIASVKESLKKLKMDYVDLLMVHWPINTEFFNTWRAFEELKKEGLTRSIGVSNYGMIHLQYLATQAHEMPVINQIECHPWLNQKPLLKFDQENHIVTQAWSPLGRGQILDHPILQAIAAAHGKTPAQVVLRWHLQNGVAIIPKSVHPSRIKENADIYDFELSDAEIAKIETINWNHRISKEPEMVYEFGEQYPYKKK
ncbi:aldo/keto reductase [Lactobacillus sp. 3B(2020)]|uniref:aldo/keto reductase n=1 Tax=Lactobacillus sp. 3B(2020) TaxID=2695882 RepID=UPI0015DFE94E|nr:aldo/keto reductase [Lactobacillus sp. 3B(2020)]QLL69134.1 aldo/keto reductase [Lactobacillus sp. 3B(2020)]